MMNFQNSMQGVSKQCNIYVLDIYTASKWILILRLLNSVLVEPMLTYGHLK
jgi:hypothetical protein